MPLNPYIPQTLLLDPHFPVARRTIAPTMRVRIGGGAQQLRRMYERPIYEFTISEKQADPVKERYLWSFFFRRQGDSVFWFDPQNPWSVIPSTDPILFDTGDGVQTHFLLPNRHLFAATFVAYRDGVLDTASPSLDAEAGLVTYGSPPAAGVNLQASYSCLYRCVLASEGEALWSEENFAHALVSFDGLVLREVP